MSKSMNAKAIHDPRYHTLVGIISDTRKRKGLTQFELGRRLLLSRQTIQKIESCEVKLDLVRYVALCRILGLNAGPLLGRLEEPSEEDDPLYLSHTPLPARQATSAPAATGNGVTLLLEPLDVCVDLRR